jgi:hypothetical protein
MVVIFVIHCFIYSYVTYSEKLYDFRYYKEGDQSEFVGLDELFAHT